MGASVGAGVYSLFRFADRLTSKAAIPDDVRRWKDELETRAIRAVQADMHAAECRAALVQLMGELPADYDPTALLAVNIAAGVHRAVVEQAEQSGIIKAGTFRAVYGAETISEPSPELAAVVKASPSPPRPRWEKGKLVVR